MLQSVRVYRTVELSPIRTESAQSILLQNDTTIDALVDSRSFEPCSIGEDMESLSWRQRVAV